MNSIVISGTLAAFLFGGMMLLLETGRRMGRRRLAADGGNDLTTARRAALQTHPPAVNFVLLALVAFIRSFDGVRAKFRPSMT